MTHPSERESLVIVLHLCLCTSDSEPAVCFGSASSGSDLVSTVAPPDKVNIAVGVLSQ